MARRATLRASDSDREQIAERLRRATAEGRLLAEELEERLGAAFSARTYGELDMLVADLPAGPVDRRRRAALPAWVAPALALAIAIPVAVAIVAVAVFVITGMLAMWVLWLAIGWWFLGYRRRMFGRRWSCSPRTGRWTESHRRPVGGFTPWL